SKKGIKRTQLDVVALRDGRKNCAHCVFEPVYFSMPDSNQFELSVYEARKRMGKALAEYDKDLEIDVVISVPDSSNVQALGYAQHRNIPFEIALIRNHYVGRTFIKPDQAGRDESVKQKFNPIKSRIKGKRIILVDDSIVRGTTMRKLAGMIRGAGAKEIHLRIASPAVKFPCFYGLDTSSRKELIANSMECEELKKFLKVDSLKYMKQNDLSKAVKNDDDKFCFACFDGKYPIELLDMRF
ncbi:MAG: amidophosphoribosyltransferase, partial [Desulfobacteraceae bacterium]|nr:amidophosphoribosyltransferase [Desulfobacteraceae bacterium]